MMWSQMLRFGLVGALATLVHILIGNILIQSGWQPLIANALAFATAFGVSFIGHLGYSFADQQPRILNAFLRFLLVALIGFTCNEAMLTAFLHLTPAGLALCISTIGAACLTFVLSKYWAFQQACPPPLPPGADPIV